MNKKKKFRETSLDELLNISYEMWERSIKEYKEGIGLDNNTYKDAMKYRYYHSKLTGDIALNLYFKYSNSKDEIEGKILYLSALIHDIKKLHKKHSIEGAVWARNNLEDYLYISKEDIEDISLLIRHHKSSRRKLQGIENKNIVNLIVLLQVADSLSKFKEKAVYKEIDQGKIFKKLNEVLYKFKNEDHKEN